MVKKISLYVTMLILSLMFCFNSYADLILSPEDMEEMLSEYGYKSTKEAVEATEAVTNVVVNSSSDSLVPVILIIMVVVISVACIIFMVNRKKKNKNDTKENN